MFRGVTSTAIIYDEKPIFDHFRFMSENAVIAAMDKPKLFGARARTTSFLHDAFNCI